jgi:hypothetical protein
MASLRKAALAAGGLSGDPGPGWLEEGAGVLVVSVWAKGHLVRDYYPNWLAEFKTRRSQFRHSSLATQSAVFE